MAKNPRDSKSSRNTRDELTLDQLDGVAGGAGLLTPVSNPDMLNDSQLTAPNALQPTPNSQGVPGVIVSGAHVGAESTTGERNYDALADVRVGISTQQDLGNGVTYNGGTGIGADASLHAGVTGVNGVVGAHVIATSSVDMGHGTGLTANGTVRADADVYLRIGIGGLSTGAEAGQSASANISQRNDGDLGSGITGHNATTVEVGVKAEAGAHMRMGPLGIAGGASTSAGVYLAVTEGASIEGYGAGAGGSVTAISPGFAGLGITPTLGEQDGKYVLGFKGSAAFLVGGIGGDFSVSVDKNMVDGAVVTGAHHVADTAVHVAPIIADGATQVGHTIAGGTVDAAHTVAGGIVGAGNTIGSGIVGIGNTIDHGVADISNTIVRGTNEAVSAGTAVAEHVANEVRAAAEKAAAEAAAQTKAAVEQAKAAAEHAVAEAKAAAEKLAHDVANAKAAAEKHAAEVAAAAAAAAAEAARIAAEIKAAAEREAARIAAEIKAAQEAAAREAARVAAEAKAAAERAAAEAERIAREAKEWMEQEKERLKREFEETFCHVAGTPIAMADGSYKPVEQLKMGDEVLLGGTVLGRGEVMASNLYSYRGTMLNGRHAVFEDGTWTRVEDSALATALDMPATVVYPIVTANHLLVCEQYICADLAEMDKDIGAVGRLAAMNADTERNRDLLRAEKAYGLSRQRAA